MESIAAPGRRTVVGGVAAGAALGAGIALPAAPAGAAAAGGGYAPASFTGVPLLSSAERHLVSRFSYGVTPALAAQVRRAGGASAWFERQLRPASLADGVPSGFSTWWPSLTAYDARTLWERQVTDVEGLWEVAQSYQRRTLVRRTVSNRQLLEVMTELWENHFNVPVNGDPWFTWRVGYGDVIRSHALGRFSDLLAAAVTHPAMLMYLDQARSTKARPNENLGRELLELHTVGRGSYDEDDVKDSARILTGWWVEMFGSWNALYRSDQHATGRVSVMGFSDANADPDGRALTTRYLDYLAHHPATARRVATRLAVKFVRDDPSAALVERLAQVYLANDTAIVPVLRALVASAEFKGSARRKVRDPGEDVVATYRALGVGLGRPGAPDSAANAMLWQVGNLGMSPLAWPRPDGAPLTSEPWSSPSRVLASFELHWVMSGGWWPSKDVTYRRPAAWLPRHPISHRMLVDYLARTMLHQRSTAQLLEACCLATGVGPNERITPDHPLVRWNLPRLLTTLLDSPAHLTR